MVWIGHSLFTAMTTDERSDYTSAGLGCRVKRYRLEDFLTTLIYILYLMCYFDNMRHFLDSVGILWLTEILLN